MPESFQYLTALHALSHPCLVSLLLYHPYIPHFFNSKNFLFTFNNTEARPGALHAYDFILRPNNPKNALSATAAQYAGPQTNRLTVKVAAKAAKAVYIVCQGSRPLRMLS